MPRTVWPLAFAAAVCLCTGAFAQSNYQLLNTITVPGGLAGFDISWVDAANSRYYLADHTATKGTGRIDVVDTRSMKLLYTIPAGKNETGFTGTVANPACGFSGNSGPNGVLAIPELNQLWVGDGDSTLKVVDLGAKAIVATIPTGGSCRADELAYDAADHIVVIANDQDNPPFLTFVSTDTLAVLGHYTYPASQIGNGLEQPVWNPKNDRFYLSVPQNAYNTGTVDIINPLTMKVESSIPTLCSPAGLVLTPNQRLMTSCGQAIDALTGRYIALQNQAQADEVWYNPGDNYYYFGWFYGNFGPFSGQGTAVVDATTNQLLTFIPAGVHSVAVDPNYNRVFIPVTGSGIQVWAAH